VNDQIHAPVALSKDSYHSLGGPQSHSGRGEDKNISAPWREGGGNAVYHCQLSFAAVMIQQFDSKQLQIQQWYTSYFSDHLTFMNLTRNKAVMADQLTERGTVSFGEVYGRSAN
jgi:hypothetical protein